MGIWDLYNARLDARGASLRGARLQREQNYVNRKLPSSLAYQAVVVNGAEQQLAVINSDNFELKTVCSLPGEDILSGSLVEFADNRWLVIREDANKEVYTRAVMQQCNYLAKWIVADDEGVRVLERWCIVFDRTTHLAGETSNNFADNRLTLGDGRIAMLIARDPDTIRLNRSNRFIIDDYDSPTVLTYRLTKPFKPGGIFNGRGVMSYVLSEVNTEDDDNLELHIADYYKHFPRPAMTSLKKGDISLHEINNDGKQDGKKVWL